MQPVLLLLVMLLLHYGCGLGLPSLGANDGGLGLNVDQVHNNAGMAHCTFLQKLCPAGLRIYGFVFNVDPQLTNHILFRALIIIRIPTMIPIKGQDLLVTGLG